MSPLDPYKVLEFYLPWILKQFQLPRTFKIFLVDGENPKKPKNYGYYCNDPKEVVIFMGKHSTIEMFLDTLGHELKHAEQYFLRKLSHGWHDDKHWKENPESNTYYLYSSDILKENYWNLPWELGWILLSDKTLR